MKKLFVLMLFAALSFALQAQDQFVQIITNPDSAGVFRFQRIEVRQYENFTDTLIIDRFPETWLDSAQLKAYQESLIDRLIERQTEMRRLLKIAKDEVNVQVSFYDAINGDGSYLALQKEKLLQSLQGAWKLIDRNGDVTAFDITVTGSDFRRNAQRFGTITVTDNLTVLLTGFYPFDLEFSVLQNGTLRASRGNNENFRLFILRR